MSRPLLLLAVATAVVGIIILNWMGTNKLSPPHAELVAEYSKLDGVKKAITKVVRTGKQDAKLVIVVDKEMQENNEARFILLIRETGRCRTAESIFREAGGSEKGWDAVEEFLPGSDTDPRFHAELKAGLVNIELNFTVWDVINWEEKGY